MTLPDGRVGPPGRWYKQRLDFEYNTVVPAKLEFIKLTSQDSEVGNASTSYSVTEKGKLEKNLSTLIDLPGFGLKNGTRVILPEQPQSLFRFENGRVVAVVDSKSVKAAQSARWRQGALHSRSYYIGMCSCLVVVIFALIWRRNRG